VAFTLASWFVTLSAPVHAEERARSELVTARHLFAEATAHEGRSEFELAMAKLKSAIAIKETPGLRYHLAHCEEQLGQLVTASGDYERAAELVRDGFRAPDVELLLPSAVHRVSSRMARLDFAVPLGVTAVVEVDDRRLSVPAADASVRLDPGAHRVVVRAPGHPEFHAELTFVDGQRRTLKVLFAERAHANPDTPAAASPGARPSGATSLPTAGKPSSVPLRRAVLIGEAALAVVGLGVGIGSAIVRHRSGEDARTYQTWEEHDASDPKHPCANQDNPTLKEDCTGFEEATQRVNTAVTLEKVGFITAGAATGLFLATWLLWPSSPGKASVAVDLRPDRGVVFATGSF
jgi:hypothetical protein